MPESTFYHKRHLCYVDDTDFTDYQGVGSDPLYRRYESVCSVVDRYIDSSYRSFLATPDYEDGRIHWYVDEWRDSPVCLTELQGEERAHYEQIKEETLAVYRGALDNLSTDELLILAGALRYVSDEFIYCYDDKVVLVAWGMRPDENRHIVNGAWVKGLKREEKVKIHFNPGQHGRLEQSIMATINRKKGERLTVKDVPELKVDEGFIFTGWSPQQIAGTTVESEMTFTALYDAVQGKKPEMHTVRFDSGENGRLNGVSELQCPNGHVLTATEIPSVMPARGFRFYGWTPDITTFIDRDIVFTADLREEMLNCTFSAGEHGTLKGRAEWTLPLGGVMNAVDIPKVEEHKGYRFKGWNVSPLTALTSDTVFTAIYEKRQPWYKRLFTGKGCLKRLLWLLLFLLLLGLLVFLLSHCHGCRGLGGSSDVDVNGDRILPEDEVEQIDRITGDDGTARDDNGAVGSIIDDEGNLPENGVVSPVVGDDGQMPPVISNPGTPDVIANRLNIYFEDEKADLNKWAKDFKRAYPSNEFAVIGYDPNVKMIQIQVPENRRNQVREELNQKIPDQAFFVLDESIMTLRSMPGGTADPALKGWHLKAARVQEAWRYTRGDPNLVVAIVDDGFDVGHSMFSGRFYKAYNVFTQNRNLSLGQGHGTHVAALAVGGAEGVGNGAAGVAPGCKIMPIQVFDNGVCTFSSVASGMMYAIHHGASVVNISIGPSFQGLDKMPVETQKEVITKYFKNEERVYRHIIKKANEKNVILVFAAGNDNILAAIAPECRLAGNTVNVAACNPDFKAAEFTNYSQGTSISAPGVAIWSAFPKNSYKMMDGTSMSAPMVTGAVALMRSIKPELTVGQIIKILQRTGRTTDQFIPPMILIDKALEAVKTGRIPPGDNVGQDTPKDANSGTVGEGGRPTDDYAALKEMLDKLKSQRDELNRKISEIEKKIK